MIRAGLHASTFLSTCRLIHISICLSVYVRPAIRLPVDVCIYSCMHLHICTSKRLRVHVHYAIGRRVGIVRMAEPLAD